MRALILSLMLLSACTAHVVRCDKHLQPINPPAGPAVGLAGAAGDAATAKAVGARSSP